MGRSTISFNFFAILNNPMRSGNWGYILAGGLGGLFFRILQTQKISGSSPKKKVFFFSFCIDFVLRPPKSGRSFRPSVCMSERAQELFKYSVVQSLYQVHQLTYVHAHTIRTGTWRETVGQVGLNIISGDGIGLAQMRCYRMREGGNIVKQKRDRDYRSQEEQCPPRHAIITQIYYLSTLLQYICQQTRLLRDPFPCILMFETQVFGQSVSVPSITSERHKNKKISAFVSTIYWIRYIMHPSGLSLI